ncbi:hypothetical protein HN51_057875 [Arachis hypogaea]|uniref:isoflavone reductase homolog n=1 Tax=Arachis ipaensis TaxID=130454 RepID=UPI000A2B7046|nr:isoflavone reductase homolog [Arachis ipaensis]
MVVRKAIEEANIPFTYISANLFVSYFAGSLSQMGSFVPPREKVHLFGDGTLKAIFVDEDDVATYTIKTINDPHTFNKILYLRRRSKYQIFHTVHTNKASEDKSFSCVKQEDDANGKVGVTLSKEKRPYDNCRGCFENQHHHHHIKPSCTFKI